MKLEKPVPSLPVNGNHCTMGTQRNGFKQESFIVSVDVGTTSIKCHVFDKKAQIKGSCTSKVILMYPEEGRVEIDPEVLWREFVSVIKGAVQDAGIQMRQVKGLGISTQRSTFTTWDRNTGRTFHNFISWQDLRATELVQSWNTSYTMKAIHGVMKLLYFLSSRKRFLAASLVVFSTQHVTLRLAWALTHYTELSRAVSKGTCCFGTIDTWLLYKLTKACLKVSIMFQNSLSASMSEGLVHATDYSNASSTGIFDTYQMCWSGLLCSLISLPLSILPDVLDTGYNYGSTDPSIFGVPIPIMSLMADQQAAMFGECCFDVGDVKITMGTGTFMDINTGNKPHTSMSGLYPVVGWKLGSEVVYLAEGNAADTGTAIRWAQELELFSDVRETALMAGSVEDSDGVCFVPSFSGLQAPLNDPQACASFMGLKPSTTKQHLVRAILESIAFRSKQLYEVMLRETNIPINKIRADGGVCTNNFVMQLTADVFGRQVSRPAHHDMSCVGAAYLAGLGMGFWSGKEELKKLQTTEREFLPRRGGGAGGDYMPVLRRWERALQRSMNWYSKE